MHVLLGRFCFATVLLLTACELNPRRQTARDERDAAAPDAVPADDHFDGGVDSKQGVTRLTIVISNATLGGDVTLMGPDGFTRRLAATTTFTNLSPGTYSVRSLDVWPPEGGRVSKANPARASLQVGETEASVVVDYSVQGIDRPTTAALPSGVWLTGQNLVNFGFGLPDGDFNADLVVDPNSTSGNPFSHAIAFDGHGGLWIATMDSVQRIAAAGSVSGDLGTIDLTLFRVFPYALAFDKSENLWVAGQDGPVGNDSAAVLRFDREDLIQFKSRAAYPRSRTVFRYGSVENIAFDTRGDLWLGFPTQGIGVISPPASGLTLDPMMLKNASFNPDFANGANPGPAGIAFDRHGNLWVVHKKANEVVGFENARILSSPKDTPPSFHIDLPPAEFNGTHSPVRIALDPCKDELYVLSAANAKERIYRYDLADPANPKLLSSFTSPDIGPWIGSLMGLAANPVSVGMPLHNAVCAPD